MLFILFQLNRGKVVSCFAYAYLACPLVKRICVDLSTSEILIYFGLASQRDSIFPLVRNPSWNPVRETPAFSSPITTGFSLSDRCVPDLLPSSSVSTTRNFGRVIRLFLLVAKKKVSLESAMTFRYSRWKKYVYGIFEWWLSVMSKDKFHLVRLHGIISGGINQCEMSLFTFIDFHIAHRSTCSNSIAWCTSSYIILTWRYMKIISSLRIAYSICIDSSKYICYRKWSFYLFCLTILMGGIALKFIRN